MMRFLRYFLKNEMPIWLSIALAAGVGIGAYFLAPVINKEIAYDNARAAHVAKTIDLLNEKVITLAKSVRSFNKSLFYGRGDIDARKDIALDSITELQWLLIDVDSVLERENTKRVHVHVIKNDLARLFKVIQNAKDPEDQERVIEQMDITARNASYLISDLYVAAKLRKR